MVQRPSRWQGSQQRQEREKSVSWVFTSRVGRRAENHQGRSPIQSRNPIHAGHSNSASNSAKEAFPICRNFDCKGAIGRKNHVPRLLSVEANVHLQFIARSRKNYNAKTINAETVPRTRYRPERRALPFVRRKSCDKCVRLRHNRCRIRSSNFNRATGTATSPAVTAEAGSAAAAGRGPLKIEPGAGVATADALR